MYVYMRICLHEPIYIYIHIAPHIFYKTISLYIYIYTYMYMHIDSKAT